MSGNFFFLQKLFHQSDLNQSGSLTDLELQKAVEAAGNTSCFCILVQNCVHVITAVLVITLSSYHYQVWMWMTERWGWWCFGIHASLSPRWRISSLSCCDWIRCQVRETATTKYITSRNKFVEFINFKMWLSLFCIDCVFPHRHFQGQILWWNNALDLGWGKSLNAL